MREMLDRDVALVIIDAQNDYLHERGAISIRRGKDLSRARAAVPRLNQLVHAARRANVPVLYVRNTHAPQNTLPNKLLKRGPSTADLWPIDGTWGADWYEGLERPTEGDVVIDKHNYDSFNDSSLSLHLRSLNVDTLVLCGFATEVCVESTCRRAFVEGFYAVVPPETTYGFSPEAVEASLAVIDNFFGTVMSADDVERAWEARASAH